MSDLGGFVEGAIAGQQYAQSKTLFGLTVQQDQQKLQEGSLDIQSKELQLQQAKLLIERQNKINQMLQQSTMGGAPTAQGTANDLASTLFRYAQADFDNQLPEQGMEVAKQAMEMQKNQAEIAKQTAEATGRKINEVTQTLGNAKNMADVQAGIVNFQTLYPEDAKDPNVQRIIEHLQKGYDPEFIKSLTDSLKDQHLKAQIAAEKANAYKAAAQAHEAQVRADDYLPKLMEEADTRTDHLRKSGGVKFTTTSSDVSAISKMAERDYPNAVKDMLWDLSRSVADAAKVYEKRDGMPRAAAQDKAYKEALQQKHFDGAGKIELGNSPDAPIIMTKELLKDQTFLKSATPDRPRYVFVDNSNFQGLMVFDGTTWTKYDAPDDSDKTVEDPEAKSSD